MGMRMSKERFTIPPRRFRGETAVVASRLPVELVSLLDELSRKSGRSRNEVIQMCLEYAIDNMEDEEGDAGLGGSGQAELDMVRVTVEQVKAKLVLLPGDSSREKAALDALLDDLKYSMMGKAKKDTGVIDARLRALANRMAAEVDNLVDIHSSEINGLAEIRIEMQALIQERNIQRKS